MVKAAKRAERALERLWTDRARVTVREPYIRSDGSTGFTERVVLEAVPCRLSFFDGLRSTNAPVKDDGPAARRVQSVRLFLAPDAAIPAGSKIAVTRADGRTTLYAGSSQPAVYRGHQEINLELLEKWA